MKIAHKNQKLRVIFAVGGFLAGAALAMPAYAQTATVAASPADTPVAASAAPQITPPPADASPVLATTAVAVTPKDDKETKSLGHSEDKISDSVKSLARRLSDTDAVTLDDLNAARQTVAKIEALIDIEKHMNELEKLRSERENKGETMAAIPASALSMGVRPGSAPMPVFPPMPANAIPASAVQGAFPPSFGGNPEIVRIVGVGGRFNAVMKGGDGQNKTVSVGDTIDGATVTSITASGVDLMRHNKTQTLRVKNVQTVFGSTP